MKITIEIQLSQAAQNRILRWRQAIQGVSSKLTRPRVLSVVVSCGLLTSIVVYAATITKTYTFSAGSSISSSQVNGDFDQLFAEINAKETRLSKLESTFYIAGNGNVGIGNTSPSVALDVTGRIKGGGVFQQIVSQGWKPNTESGTSTSWASLPTDMSLSITTDNSTLLMWATIDRVQHSNGSTLTEYRIVVDGNVAGPMTSGAVGACHTNIGEHSGWNYRVMSLFCVATVTAGAHTVRVQYQTAGGTEYWYSDGAGVNNRGLIVQEIKN